MLDKDNKELIVKNYDLSSISVNDIDSKDLDMVLSELETLSQNSPLDYKCFNPQNGKDHPKQKAFHCSDKKIRFLSGGNRSGKTEGGVAEDVMHSTGLYPDWFPTELKYKTATRGRVVVTDFSKGGAVFEEKLWKWLPKDLVVSVKRTVKGTIEKIAIRHTSGGISVIELLTHEQDDMVFEGWSGHWAHFDEPPPREKFIATLRGLIDFKGRCWLTLTPISEPWLYDEFISKEDQDVLYTTVDIRDNPFLDEDEIKSFESRLTEDEKEARLHGRFKHLTGLVYKMFDPEVHIVPRKWVQIEQKWPKYFVCDPHDRKPHFGIWATVDPLGRLYIIDEIKFKGTLKEFSSAVLQREVMRKDLQIRSMEVIRIGDPNKMNTPSAVNGLKFKEEFSKHGLHFISDVNDDIALGHLAVAEKLSYDTTAPLSTTNAPRMFFVRENTPECVRYMQMYVWDEWRGSGRDSRTVKEKPQEKFKDFCDCVRYLVMYGPAYFEDEPDPLPYRGGGSTGYGL